MKIKKAFTMFAAATAVVSITPVQACVSVQPCLKNINTENIFQEESMVVCKENENIVDTDKRTIDENSTGISETNNVDETDMQPCDDTFDVETPDSLDNADMSKLEDQASDGTAIEDNKIDAISMEDVNDSTDPDDNINEEADIPDMDDANDATLQQSEDILDDEIKEDQDDTDMLETGKEEIENNDESIEDNIDPINSDALFENEDDALDSGDRKYVSFETVNVKAPTVDARQGTLSQPHVTNIETLPSDDNVKSISEPMLAENKTKRDERTTHSKQRSSSVDGITLSNDSKSVNNSEIKPEPSNSDDANFSNKDEDLNSSSESIDNEVKSSDNSDATSDNNNNDYLVNNVDSGSVESQNIEGSGEVATKNITERNRKKLHIASVVFAMIFGIISFGFYKCLRILSISRH